MELEHMHSGQLYPFLTWLEASEASDSVCGDRKHPDKFRVRTLAAAHMTDHSPPPGTEFSTWHCHRGSPHGRLAFLGS